jgi:hypothetical protein
MTVALIAFLLDASPINSLGTESRPATLPIVSIAELKDELDRLSAEERRQLTAYLVTKDRMLDREFSEQIARKIDDQNPARWVSLDEAEKRLLP